MLIHAEKSLLLLIDLQEKLMPAIHDGSDIVRHSRWLAEIARHLSVPVVATLQYPAGLGALVPDLATCVSAENCVEKIHFSAVANGGLGKLPAFSRQQILLTGVETHVCVLQTALDLLALGKEVFVVADAVGSRRPADRDRAFDRLSQAGCVIVSPEMVVFEWLQKAGTEMFKKISREFLR